ncbi:site-specific integrase [Paraburkholderia sp. BCC1885]|uniref:site-specific integrase n=1 Tax=Paraburkholderia sp. BCC1885 TaxID=2562669 RepID=UPI001183EC02|nr:site-specific integrase [Paraburkholderia sp. BCC1885]
MAGCEHAFTHVLREREAAARRDAEHSTKPWTLHADQQTKNILADCPERNVSTATAAKYRREYDRLRADGLTALEKATTRNHHDLLRTASRYCMEADVRALRRQAERARRAEHIGQAQRLTVEAWKLAAEMDVQFLQPDRLTWKHKAQAMRDAGEVVVSKSKRDTRPPPPSLAVAALLTTGQHGTKLAERHAEQLALLALFGIRPSELLRGVAVSVATNPANGHLFITATIKGAKVNEQRGQAVRQLVVPVDNTSARGLAQTAQERGGAFVVKTTDADHRSLNRGLKASGLSCYSFRHAVASELKKQMAARPDTAQRAATFMGHTSTKSLMSYGRASHARGGRKFGAKADRSVKSAPVTYGQKAAARQARATTQRAAVRQVHAPTQAVVPRIPKPGSLSLLVPKPVLTIPRGPKPPGQR